MVDLEMMERHRQRQAIEEAARRDEVQNRLDRGEEIDLEDATCLFGLRLLREPWLLSDLDTWGMVGGPCEPVSKLSPRAWLHLRLEFVSLDWLAVTPEKTRIYEVRLRRRQSDEDDAIGGASPHRVLGDVLAEIATARRPDGSPLRESDYSGMLAAAGLSLGPKWWVSRVTMDGAGGFQISDGPGLSLTKALAFAYLAIDRARYETFPSLRGVARDIYRRVATDHPHILGVEVFKEVDDRRADDLVSVLRQILRATVRPSQS